MAAISTGPARAGAKAATTRGGVAGETLHIEVPILDGQGRERTYFNLELFVPDGMTAAELAAWAAAQPNGLYALWIASKAT